jgi:hypothetical protein
VVSTRKYMVGRTTVFADRQGPYQFWRQDGAGQWVEVPCVCDPDYNLVCRYHEETHRRGNYGLAA